MKKRVVIVLTIVFIIISIGIILFSIFLSKKYENLKLNLSKEIKNLNNEIDNNSKKLIELTKENSDKQKSEDNMTNYIKILEEKVKSYEN